MSWFSDILKIASPIASFIPGAGPLVGAGLGAIDAALGGAKQQRQADRQFGLQQQQGSADLALYNQYAPQLLQALMGQIGFDANTGKFSSVTTNKPAYDVDALIRLSAEDAARASGQAAGNLNADMRRSGFVGGTGYDMRRREIFSDQSIATADAARRVRATAEQERFQREQMLRQNQQGQIGQALNFLTGGRNLALGNAGGLGAMYASQANNTAQGLGQTLGSILQGFGRQPGARGPNAGDNTLATNNAPTPLPGATPPIFGATPTTFPTGITPGLFPYDNWRERVASGRM